MAGCPARRACQSSHHVAHPHVAFGNFGNHKAAGGHGVQELRVDYGPGNRVYYAQQGKLLVILLCGGDKDTQRKDINAARKLAASL